jgi:hypothetical protein
MGVYKLFLRAARRELYPLSRWVALSADRPGDAWPNAGLPSVMRAGVVKRMLLRAP